MSKFNLINCVAILAAIVSIAFADTPANCTYEDLVGTWVFHEGPRGNDNTLNCSEEVNITSAMNVKLLFPNIAVDDDGNTGVWTLIYNQGFEIELNHRKYFAFSLYEQNGTDVTSICSHTMWGWAHETGVHPSDWSCTIGARTDLEKDIRKVNKLSKIEEFRNLVNDRKIYSKNLNFVNKINSHQSSWTAKHYDFMENMKITDLVRMAGGKNSKIINKPKPAPTDEATRKLADSLPDNFDWRDISGTSFVSPVRNQGACGSCYAFGSLGMNEARLRVATNNTVQTIFSTQDIVECSEYSQGCDGGFPYLIGGKYAEDYGLVEESCNPYTGKDGACSTKKACDRSYSTRYQYVGGFYGACNEALMQIELVKNGPVAVAFEVYNDFMTYSGGIYHHTFLKDIDNFGFNPFQLTNHAVLLVGYGTEEGGEKYWIVKNSWGEGWGENGFFRIRRGTDECAIESIAVISDIVV